MNGLARSRLADLHSVFAGGRGAAVWSARMARLAACRDDFERGCGWLRELLAPPPRLRQGPLLGTCLEELTAETRADDESPAEHGRRRLPRSPVAAPPGKRTAMPAGRERAAAMPRTSASPRVASREPRAASLPATAARVAMPQAGEAPPRRVNGELLTRLAGTASPPRRDRPRGSASGRKRGWAPPSESSGPLPRELRGRGLADFDRRARRAILQSWHRSLKAPAAADDEEVPRNPAADTFLDGAGAPRRLLERWLDVFRGTRREESPGVAAAQRRRSETAPEARTAPHRRTPPFDAAERPDATGRSEPAAADPRAAAAGREAVAPPIPQRAEASGAAAGLRERPERPPGGELSLPALLPAMAGDFTPAAAAARVLRVAGDRRAAAAGDDLAELAAKLERILDDEARRHGIDV